jgi:hypothetical protein
MAGSIHVDKTGVPPQHRFDASRVGGGNEYENVSLNADGEVFVRIGAFTVSVGRSVLPPEGAFRNPAFLAIARSVANGVKCLVDTGSMISVFRGEVARELGLDPDGGEIDDYPVEIFGGDEVRCCRRRYLVYLDIGPYPIPVPVEFPVEAVKTGTTLEYRWLENFPAENILGMESVLGRRMLCFTPDYLYAFENLP